MVKKTNKTKISKEDEKVFAFYRDIESSVNRLGLNAREVLATMELFKYVTLKNIYDLADNVTNQIISSKNKDKVPKEMYG